MELKTPTPLGAEDQKEKKKKKSITDRFLSIAKERKEEKIITFPDIYLPKKKAVSKETGIKLKSPTPLGEDDNGKDKKIEDKENTDIPEIFRPQKKDSKKYQREKVVERNNLKPPTPLGQREKPTTISMKDIDIKKHLNKLNPLSLLKKIKLLRTPKLTKKQKKKVAYASIFLIPFLLFISLLLAILIYTRSEPYNLAQDFIQRIQERATDEAYELTTQAYQAITSKKEFSELSTKLNSVDLANAKRIKKTIKDEGVMGKYALVRYRASGYYIDITLFNDDSNWGIHTIELIVIDK